MIWSKQSERNQRNGKIGKNVKGGEKLDIDIERTNNGYFILRFRFALGGETYAMKDINKVKKKVIEVIDERMTPDP